MIIKDITLPIEADFIAYPYACSDSDEMNIDGDNLLYAQLGKTHHGLQCNHIGNTEKYNQIMDKCKQVANLLKEIKELNNG